MDQAIYQKAYQAFLSRCTYLALEMLLAYYENFKVNPSSSSMCPCVPHTARVDNAGQLMLECLLENVIEGGFSMQGETSQLSQAGIPVTAWADLRVLSGTTNLFCTTACSSMVIKTDSRRGCQCSRRN